MRKLNKEFWREFWFTFPAAAGLTILFVLLIGLLSGFIKVSYP